MLVFAMGKFTKKLLITLMSLGVFLAVPTAFAATITQGYSSSTAIPAGSVVSLENNSLVLANNQNANSLLGVAVQGGQYLVNVDGNQTTQVVSSGSAVAYVTDLNGDIKNGDVLAPSPIAGVAMKATESGRVLGVAGADFNSSNATQTTKVKDKYGRERTVKVGTIAMTVNVSDYQLSASGTSALVAGLQSVASSATGKQVTPIRAILAALVLVLALVLSIIVLYSSVSSSIRSIGRNPLSKRFVVQGLVQVIIAVFIIMIAAFSVVYIIIGS